MDETNYFPIAFDGDSFTITNSGTAPTPCKITIIPKVDMVTITITGFSKKPIVISNVKTNDELIIDGENRTIEVNGQPAWSKFTGWEFPKLYPGENTVSISNGAQAQVAVEYGLRYI